MTLYGYADVAGGRLRVSSTISQGLGVLGSTPRHDPLASRYDADGTFTALSGWMDWTRNLGSHFSLRVISAATSVSGLRRRVSSRHSRF
jgi:hypothetical protein